MGTQITTQLVRGSSGFTTVVLEGEIFLQFSMYLVLPRTYRRCWNVEPAFQIVVFFTSDKTPLEGNSYTPHLLCSQLMTFLCFIKRRKICVDISAYRRRGFEIFELVIVNVDRGYCTLHAKGILRDSCAITELPIPRHKECP